MDWLIQLFWTWEYVCSVFVYLHRFRCSFKAFYVLALLGETLLYDSQL